MKHKRDQPRATGKTCPTTIQQQQPHDSAPYTTFTLKKHKTIEPQTLHIPQNTTSTHQSTRKRNFRPRPSRSKNVSKKMIEQVLHMKQKHAATHLNIGVSTLKKKFVKLFHNERWPCTEAERKQLATQNHKIALQKASVSFLLNECDVDEKAQLREMMEEMKMTVIEKFSLQSHKRARHSSKNLMDHDSDEDAVVFTARGAAAAKRQVMRVSTPISYSTSSLCSPSSTMSTGSDVFTPMPQSLLSAIPQYQSIGTPASSVPPMSGFQNPYAAPVLPSLHTITSMSFPKRSMPLGSERRPSMDGASPLMHSGAPMYSSYPQDDRLSMV